jgi:hypothetical protein
MERNVFAAENERPAPNFSASPLTSAIFDGMKTAYLLIRAVKPSFPSFEGYLRYTN